MSKTEAWKSWEGRMVDGKYPLRQWLGGSDHSVVFLTDRPGRPSEKAAIKLLEVNSADAEREVARIRAAAQLTHPHLLTIYDVGSSRLDNSSVVYVVMEQADEDLSQILPQRPLTPAEVSDLLPALLDGLSYLHSNNMVHSRIKPSNVLAAGDQLKLSSEQVIPSGGPTLAKRGVGVFDAPEITAGTITPAADIWSLGVTIITALTQKATPLTDGPQGNMPEPFRSIARECLNIDPQRRCSVAEINARLQPPGRSVPAELPPPRVLEQDSNRLPMFVIPLVLVVLALAAWGLFHSRDKETSVPKTDTTSQPAVQPAPAVVPPAKPSPGAAPPIAKKTAQSDGGAILRRVMPDLPQSAKNTIRGTIKISVLVQVDPTGKVTSAKLKSTGPSRYFADRTLKAAQQWLFAPPQAPSGGPTTSAWLIQFRLKRNEIQASPERAAR